MCCGIGNDKQRSEYESVGLVDGHAYTLIGCFENKGVWLCKVWNPHGEFEWKGAWNDNDTKWTNDMKKKC